MVGSRRRVLLVGWDAADWKVISPLIEKGLMPNLARLIDTGVMGNMATLQPPLSPMLWTSIATGKRPYKHGVHGFSEPDPQTGFVRPSTILSRHTKAVWNILNQNGLKSLVVGWWPSNPAEPIRGAMVSNLFQQPVGPADKPWPMKPGTVYPPELGPLLAEDRLHPHDIEGDILRSFVPRAPEINQQEDQRLNSLAKIVAECTSIQGAAVHLMHEITDWDFAAVYFDAIDHFSHAFMKYHPPRLEWVSERDFELYSEVVNGGYCYHDLMLGHLLHLAGPETTVIVLSDHGFHPDHLRPRSIPNEPAGPALEHRDFGIFVASGPGIRRDELIYGARLIDVTPTLLSLFGLPMGRDMDGRVLTSIYEQPPRTEYIDSWDDVPGDDGRHPPDLQTDPIDSTEALKQLVDLGYIEDPGEDVREAVDSTVRELRYNLARAYVDGGQLAEAADLFRELWDRWPRESRFGVHLLQTQLDRGLPTEARQTFELLQQRKREAAEWAMGEIKAEIELLQKDFSKQDQDDQGIAEEFAVPDLAEAAPRARRESPQTPDLDDAQGEVGAAETKPANDTIDWKRVPDKRRRHLSKLRRVCAINRPAMAYLEGSVLQAEGRLDEALRRLQEALGVQLRNRPSLLLKMAELELQRRRWDAAASQFQAALDLDPLSPAAHLGLARVASHRGDWATAARAAQTCIGQNFHNPRAHYLVGMALARLGQTAPAIESLRQAVTVAPLLATAHRELARVLRQQGDAEGARRHRDLAREAQRWRGISAAEVAAQGVNPAELREVFEAGELPGARGAQIVELPPREETVVVVTGLPRSGTSMMMQMLQAGGVPVYVDDHRPADESNPKGYLEHERARKLATDHTWLGEAQGKAVKIVAQLLPHLSKQYKYRLVMMHRPLPEIIASQKKLLARLGREGGQITDEALQKTYLQQVRQVRALLSHHQQKGILDVLDVKYHDVLRDPQGVARVLATFLGGDFDPQKAAWAVDPTLRHERG